jgi:glycosyltransferase involved in cell wall biosynthesis
MTQSISIVIPAHNEERTIGDVVARCLEFGSYVLVVDDGSVDGTRSVALAAGANVFTVAKCSGYGHALRLGFRESKQLGYRTVVTLDGDGVHDPAFIPTLISCHLSNKAQVTIGSRFIKPELGAQIPNAKVAANCFATALFNSVVRSSFTDVASGMRVLDVSALELECPVSDFGFTYRLLEAARRHGMKIVEAGISVRYDAEKLFCTKRSELADFMRSIISIAAENNHALKVALCHLEQRIEAHQILRVDTGPRYVVAHPLSDCDSYVFQFQDSCFVDCQTPGKWIGWSSNAADED